MEAQKTLNSQSSLEKQTKLEESRSLNFGLYYKTMKLPTKLPPAIQETQVQFLGGEDPLEKEMATHSSILAWRIPWAEEPGRL